METPLSFAPSIRRQKSRNLIPLFNCLQGRPTESGVSIPYVLLHTIMQTTQFAIHFYEYSIIPRLYSFRSQQRWQTQTTSLQTNRAAKLAFGSLDSIIRTDGNFKPVVLSAMFEFRLWWLSTYPEHLLAAWKVFIPAAPGAQHYKQSIRLGMLFTPV